MITVLSSIHFLHVFCFLYRPVKGDKRTKSRDGSSSGRSVAKPRKADSTRLVYPELLGILGGGFVLPPATFNTCVLLNSIKLVLVKLIKHFRLQVVEI